MKIYDEEETVMRRPAGVVESEEVTIAEEQLAQAEAPEISVFLPVLNEEPNLRPLHAKLDDSLAGLGHTAEIIYVDDGVEPLVVKRAFERRAVADVGLDKAEVFAPLERAHVGALNRRVVKVVEVVNDRHPPAPLPQQTPDQMRPDEPRPARDQNVSHITED